MKITNKLFSLILALLAVFSLSGCQGQQVSEKVKESVDKAASEITKTKEAEEEKEAYSDWRVFENEKHKFSFKYPAGWELSENVDREDLYSLTLAKKDASQEKVQVYMEEMVPSYTINVSVEPNPDGLSAQDFYLDMFGESSKETAKEGIEKVSFGGADGIKYPEVSAPSSGPATGILLAKNSKLYRFVYGALAHQETHEKFLPEFMEILETLKFSE